VEPSSSDLTMKLGFCYAGRDASYPSSSGHTQVPREAPPQSGRPGQSTAAQVMPPRQPYDTDERPGDGSVSETKLHLHAPSTQGTPKAHSIVEQGSRIRLISTWRLSGATAAASIVPTDESAASPELWDGSSLISVKYYVPAMPFTVVVPFRVAVNRGPAGEKLVLARPGLPSVAYDATSSGG